jgi:hypothetical protein
MNAQTDRELLQSINYVLQYQWSSFTGDIDQARKTHINKDGNVDTTYAYLTGIYYGVAEGIGIAVENALRNYSTEALNYVGFGYITQKNLNMIRNVSKPIWDWAQGLSTDYKSAFSTGSQFVTSNLTPGNFTLTPITRRVRMYIGHDWN